MFNTKQKVRLMALLLGTVAAVALVTPAQAAKQPNIVVIMGDDIDGHKSALDISVPSVGFVNKWGRPNEKIYDVAVSDGRKADANGKISSVGNMVDVKKATYTNDIGDTQLATVWADPDFDVNQKAVYYVRVLERPTPRWTTYDAARKNMLLPTDVPATIQERAWPSPIWYTRAESTVCA
jgi:hypothetical protein